MNIFEYLFCRLYWWNTQIIKERAVPIFYSVTGLSVFQQFTIIPIYGLIYLLLYKSYYLEDILGVVNPFLLIGLVIFLINICYFRKNKTEMLLKKFKKIPQIEKRRKDIVCVIYIILIIIINIIVAAYFRSHN